MARPLRARKQAPAAVEPVAHVASTTIKVTKKNKPAAAAAVPTRPTTDTDLDDSTLTTPKARNPARTRASVQASSNSTAGESKSRARSANIPIVNGAPSSRTRPSAAPSSQTTRATRYTVQVPATQSSVGEIEEEDGSREPTPSTIIPSTPARRFAHGPDYDEPEPSSTQSSNAENHAPRTLLALTSSPPIAQSTPKEDAHPVLRDFSSDAGYTPPPPSTKQKPVGSVERPRLRDLDAKTLEPVGILDGWDGNDEDDEDALRLPSPSPKQRAGRLSELLAAEDEDEDDAIISVTPRAEPQRPEGGIGFFLEDDSQEFIIYSDPKSKSPSPPAQPATNPATFFDDDDIMRPPESTDSSSPARKRRSSEAGIDDDEAELTEVELTPRGKRPRATAQETRSKTNGKKDIEQPKTNDLRSLLPRRKKTTKAKKAKQHAYDAPTFRDGDADSNDEMDILTRRPVRTRKAAAGKKTTPKKKSTTKVVKSTAPLASSARKPSRTYARKSLDNTANDPIIGTDDEEANSDAGESDDGISEEVKAELMEMKKKFEEVDKWDLEYEEMSGKSSDSGKR